MAVRVNAKGLMRLLREPADVIVRYTERSDPMFDELAQQVHHTMPHVLVVTHNPLKSQNELAAYPADTWLGKVAQEVEALPTTIFYFQSGEHAKFTSPERPSTFLEAVRDTYED